MSTDDTPGGTPDTGPEQAGTGLPWPVTNGDGVPLSSAYCAERAAAAIHRAEREPDPAGQRWLQCAEHWRTLACSLATNAAMNRPRDDRDDRGRR